ncbi:uncharacterized protein [Misgurnus anguillicaudatus]|uniref:uncharacterized protein n=1 Tax=Misgurnus anguillicaudatus TaxID=75329 RepID=UPI003CCF21EF
MAYSDESQNTGFSLSETSLKKAHIKCLNTYSSSCPFVKPALSLQPCQEISKTFKKLEKVCHQGFNRIVRSHQKESSSLDESKNIIRELAAELDRVVQFKKVSKMAENIKSKETNDEQQYYILHWAEQIESILQSKHMEEEKTYTPSEKSTMESKIKWKKAKGILSDWACRLKDKKENSVCPKEEETLKDLHKQCKQGEISILPVMDWMMWTVLQSESFENESSNRQWIKNKQRSKNTVGLPIPNSVWDWIRKSTALVVLDPNTANPDLLDCKDGKSVRANNFNPKRNNWDDFQRNHSKFDGWTCVQAKEGYDTGRHYWEVNVKKKCEWRVGVVKDSAPRKGFLTMNPKTGYWNLRLQLGTIIALTEPVTKLANVPTPSKIGVYLDIEEGQVSFYDAEKRRHIYTFNTDFNGTEKIYPMFGTIETDRALVIS